MDWQITCRVCLETADMVSLFDLDENEEVLADKYTYCCDIEVSNTDSLPTLICLNCVDRLTFAYQFKQQCITSNETLKDCLQEFNNTVESVKHQVKNKSETTVEVITIKSEDGTYLQYEVPVEEGPVDEVHFMKSEKKDPNAKRPRGRARKLINAPIIMSPTEFMPKKENDDPANSTENSDVALKIENVDVEVTNLEFLEDEFGVIDANDPEWQGHLELCEEDGDTVLESSVADKEKQKKNSSQRGEVKTKRKKRRNKPRSDDDYEIEGEDVLLKETIMALSEPIPEHILHPKPPVKRKSQPRVTQQNFTCETCGKTFTSGFYLRSHINRHLGIKPYICSVCGYAAVLKTEMRRHMLRHTGEKPYKCSVCDRSFSDFGSRQKHERLHFGLRPYQCSVCGKAFTYSTVLSNHMLTHTGHKKFHCTGCGKSFTKNLYLKEHIKNHHKDLHAQMLVEEETKKKKQELELQNLSNMIAGKVVHLQVQEVQDQQDEGNRPELLITEEVETNEDHTVEVIGTLQTEVDDLEINETIQDYVTINAV